MCKSTKAPSEFRGGHETVRRGFSGTLCCLSGANILFTGNAPEIRNLGTSPPLLDECVGDLSPTVLAPMTSDLQTTQAEAAPIAWGAPSGE